MRDVFVRLEPRTRSADIEPGLAARVWDAAWLLGRQWVLGELDGEDGGTPVHADVQVTSHALETVERGGAVQRYDPQAMPLQAVIEAAPSRPGGWTLRRKLDTGLLLAQRLRAAGHSSQLSGVLRAHHLDGAAAPGEPTAAALHALALHRVPDGEKVYRAVRERGYGARWASAAGAALRAWADEVDRRHAPAAASAPSAWQPQRLEYRFAVGAAGLPEPLQAVEHHGTDLDWHGFDLGNPSGAGGVTGGRTTQHAAVPTPIRFAGMPEPRYWTFEQAQVDLGAVEASATDLARMAVLQFAFDYGNDAFLVPLRLAVGAVHRVERVMVSDTFGLAPTLLPGAVRAPSPAGAAPRQGWSFLAPLAADGRPSDLLFVPPVAAHVLRGPDLQDVRLMRDEMANLVWAIEHAVEGETGAPLDRAQALDRQVPQSFTPPVVGDLRYVLQTRVPSNWFALELAAGLPRILRLAMVAPSSEQPAGGLLRGVQRTGVHDEEVSRAGVRLREAEVLARWFGGTSLNWRRVERAVGRGEGSSGLQFDLATTQPPLP